MYRDFFHAIVAYSKQRLMTTFFNYENPEFLGISSYMPDFPVSSIVDNLILMSLVEINNSLHRCISVVKSRGSKHSFDTREFVIGQGGITLVPLEENSGARIAAAELLQSLKPCPHKIISPEANQRRCRQYRTKNDLRSAWSGSTPVEHLSPAVPCPQLQHGPER